MTLSPLKSIRVRRFKRLDEIELATANITLLIGANNAGKSSVLQALHFAVSIAQSARLVGEGLSWRSDKFELSINPAQLLYTPVADVMTVASGGNLLEEAKLRVEITLTTEDGSTCTVALKRGRNRNVSISLEGKTLGERLMDIEKPFTVYAPGLAGISREERFLSRGVLRRIVARGDANLVLRNVLLALKDDSEAWSSFINDMRCIFPGITIEVYFDRDTSEHIDVWVKLGSGPEVPLDAAGTSVLQASQILAYVGLFRPQVLILDEPDSHLHPDNQRLLCDLIARTTADRGFKALVSTHSRHVLDTLSRRGEVAWLHKGELVKGADVSTTRVLLDIGALDSIDYFTNGALRCVVATEDTDKDRVATVLWSNGFVQEETEVVSYDGCSKVDSALVLGQFLRDKANHLAFVVHRDRDYMPTASATAYAARLSPAAISAFVTEHNDIEGYFVNAEHLSHHNPGVPLQKMQELIDEATVETQDESIKSIVNLRVRHAVDQLRGTRSQPDHGQIAVDAARDYHSDPESMRRGDIVIGRLAAKIQQLLKQNPVIYAASPFLRSEGLVNISSAVWPPKQ